ncbi:hypothetical protein R1sor_012465 [Riccia sorocarpa]|uniref:Uncharacterized protein n=1 Tax=Riccia sorocarpa TaxID=122646 RepID=A0ABD3IA23_9MARC
MELLKWSNAAVDESEQKIMTSKFLHISKCKFRSFLVYRICGGATNYQSMFNPSALAVLVLKKMKGSQESRCAEPQVGEEEGFYNRVLWAIPEDEEDSAISKARKPIQVMKKHRSLLQRRDSNYKKKNGGNTNQPRLLSSAIKQMRRSTARVADVEDDYKLIKSTDDKYPFQLSLVLPPRKRADEEELSYDCDEIKQVYLAMSQGKLSFENLRMLGLVRA